MKTYIVEYGIKMNGECFAYWLQIPARSAKIACAYVKDEVFARTGRNAFTPNATPENVAKIRGKMGFPPLKPGWLPQENPNKLEGTF